jgi:hypothetical protein
VTSPANNIPHRALGLGGNPHPFSLPLTGEGEGEGISRKDAKHAKINFEIPN